MLAEDMDVQLWLPRGLDNPFYKGHGCDQPYHPVCAFAVLYDGKASTRWLGQSGYFFKE